MEKTVLSGVQIKLILVIEYIFKNPFKYKNSSSFFSFSSYTQKYLFKY